jgi:hypothetical protein
MGFKNTKKVWDYSRASHADMLVLLALADWADDVSCDCYPAIPTLACKARLTERQTRRSLNTLEHLGEIRIERSNGGRNRSSRYWLTITENPDGNTLKNIQGKIIPVIHDTETLTFEPQNPPPPVRGIYKSVQIKDKSKARVPAWLDPVLWEDFKNHRKSTKARLTAKAEELALRTLAGLREKGHDPRAVIEQSIERGWKGLFPVQEQSNGHDSSSGVDIAAAVERAFNAH